MSIEIDKDYKVNLNEFIGTGGKIVKASSQETSPVNKDYDSNILLGDYIKEFSELQ